MIVPMKKVWVLTSARDEDRSLDHLGHVGVLHLEPSRERESPAAASIRGELMILDRAVEICGGDSRLPVPELTEQQIMEKARRLVELMALIQEDESRLAALEQAQMESPAALSVDPSSLQMLEQRNIHLNFRRALREDIARIPEGLAHAVVASEGRELVLAFFTRDETIPEWLGRMDLPMRRPEETESLAEAARGRRSRHESEVKNLRDFSGSFEAQRAIHENRRIFEEARSVLEHEGPVSVLAGYCPSNRVKEVQEEALRAGWAVLVQEPDRDDPVPTLLKPSRFGRVFSPVMKVISVLPGYREGDPSALLAPFFALFTAVLLDDAGYGLLLVLAGLILRRRLRTHASDATLLILVLGAATMIWGALRGTWFGLEAASQVPLVRALSLDVFADPEQASAVTLRLCLLIGVIHLSAARLLTLVRKWPSWRVLGEAGWVCFLWGMYGLIGTLLLGSPLGWAEGSLVVAGLTTAIVFTGGGDRGSASAADYARNIPLVLLNGLGSLSDIVSYLRLFAVGLASQMLSTAFNDLAAGTVASGPPWGWLGGAVIFIAGHSTNILLAAMAVLVHGVRLNLLEFSKHAGTEWAGISYRPFAFKSRGVWEGART